MRKISKLQPALIAVFVMLGAVLVGQIHAARAAQGAAAAPLASATEAKRLLAQIDKAKIDKITDRNIRAEMQSGYAALKAVADNTARTSEKVLLARVHTAALKLKRRGEETKPAGFSLNECNSRLEDCNELGAPPELCQLGDDGCIMMAWIATLFPPGPP